jgi:beta-glucosidase-like glycosyl hydrolase
MAVGEVKGIQSQHAMAQIKHYVGYDSEGTSTFIDDLHEVYVAPFEAAIKKAEVSSIMCSYNRINGTFACGNESTLTKILRDELGFVTSDWGAVHAVNFINAGLAAGEAKTVILHVEPRQLQYWSRRTIPGRPQRQAHLKCRRLLTRSPRQADYQLTALSN